MTRPKIPMHEQIRKDLLKKIQSGEYPQHSLLPREVELIDIYGVSRPTVRQAIQSLVADGYLERKKRKGTIVRQSKIENEFVKAIESYDIEMSRKGLDLVTKVLTFKVEGASSEIASLLNVAEGTEVYRLIRLRYVEHKPNVLETTYLIKSLLPDDFLNYDFNTKALYSALKEVGMPVCEVKRKMEVLKADATISDLFGIDEGEPIFFFKTLGLNRNGVCFEYSTSKYRGDLNSFSFEIKTA